MPARTTTRRSLYDLIWTRAVASQLADAEYSVNTLTLAAQDGSQPFVFKAMGRTLIKPGWRTLTAKDAAEEPDANDTEDPEKQSDENGRVPALARGTQLHADSARVLNKQTRPPNGYTQASLIKEAGTRRNRPALHLPGHSQEHHHPQLHRRFKEDIEGHRPRHLAHRRAQRPLRLS